jgi:SAM-dependent methyltransferase
MVAGVEQPMPGGDMGDRLELPEGHTIESIGALLGSFGAVGADERARAELDQYLRGDLLRFITTLSLIPLGAGRLLEIGASPYFTTLLVRRFRAYELSLTNSFGEEGTNVERVRADDSEPIVLEYSRFNAETDPLPFEQGSFDVALFCEVLEHLTNDPVVAMAAVNSALRPGGILVMTTPNVARLSVLVNAVKGRSVHSPYSAYGAYGRHNREYSVTEVKMLVEHAGFEVEACFTGEGAPSPRPMRQRIAIAAGTLCGRDLGGYIFLRARKRGAPSLLKPRWLYQSYSAEHSI